jgi:hypothetical protein
MIRRLLPFCLLALSACSGATPLSEPDAATSDVANPQVNVTAAIASASLANDCPSVDAGSAGAALCAPRRPAADGGAADEACGGGYCRQTSLQITFTVTAVGGAPVDPVNPVTITGVRLLDSATGANLDALTPREPQRWEGAQYVTWDSTLRGFGETRASFKLSAPNWNQIGSGNSWSTYGRAYRLEVTVVVNGQTLVLRSGELMRAPEVVT